MELKYPFDIECENVRYTLTKGDTEGRVNMTCHDEGVTYRDAYNESTVRGWLENGSYKLLPPAEEKTDPLSFKVNIDHSDITAALAEAKELEATLLRIKGMFA
jgi:hypothetical protein